MHYSTRLFSKDSLTEYFDKKKQYAERRAHNKHIRPDTIEEKWIDNFINEFLLDPIEINLDEKKLEYRTRTNDPKKLYIVIKVPFTATKELLGLTPPQLRKTSYH